jgi:hypothetical protein
MNGKDPTRIRTDRTKSRATGRRIFGASMSRQKGMTTLGFIILALFVSLVGFGVLRLTPMYLNYMKVVGVVNGVQGEFDGQKPTRALIRTSISRRFDVESVSVIRAKDVTVTTVDGGMEVAAIYDHTSPFIGNISFTVHYNKTELIRR